MAYPLRQPAALWRAPCAQRRSTASRTSACVNASTGSVTITVAVSCCTQTESIRYYGCHSVHLGVASMERKKRTKREEVWGSCTNAREVSMVTWIRGHETLLWWLGALSIVMAVGTLVVLPPDCGTPPGRLLHPRPAPSRWSHAGQDAAPAGPRREEPPRHRAHPGRCGHVSAARAGDSDDPDWPYADGCSGEACPRTAPGAAALGMASYKLDTGESAPASLADACVFSLSLREGGGVKT